VQQAQLTDLLFGEEQHKRNSPLICVRTILLCCAPDYMVSPPRQHENAQGGGRVQHESITVQGQDFSQDVVSSQGDAPSQGFGPSPGPIHASENGPLVLQTPSLPKQNSKTYATYLASGRGHSVHGAFTPPSLHAGSSFIGNELSEIPSTTSAPFLQFEVANHRHGAARSPRGAAESRTTSVRVGDSRAAPLPDFQSALENPANLTQTELQRACKRINIKCGGSKSEVVKRLAENGYVSLQSVSKLSTMFEDLGPQVMPRSRVQSAIREPMWTAGESFRLIAVVSDPRHATDVYYMYHKPEDRSGIDVRREDPFTSTFEALFNDVMYEPEAPDAALGITQGSLDEMAEEAALRPHKRKGDVLKNRWRVIRTGFTTVWQKYVASGQQNPDAFPDFLLPDPTSNESRAAMYCAASFHGQPSLNQVVKAIPRMFAAEEGVTGSVTIAERHNFGGSEEERSVLRCKKRVRNKGSGSATDSADMAAALAPIADALSRPVHLSFNTSESSPKRQKSVQTVDRLQRNALAHDYASTLTTLMDLESSIEKQIKEALENQEEESKIDKLKTRLATVIDQIESAERPGPEDIGD
jgi:hypothetical protein